MQNSEEIFNLVEEMYDGVEGSKERLIAAIERLEAERDAYARRGDFWKSEREKACNASLGMSFQLQVKHAEEIQKDAALGRLVREKLEGWSSCRANGWGCECCSVLLSLQAALGESEND